jgi:leucyl aminopeptidase
MKTLLLVLVLAMAAVLCGAQPVVDNERQDALKEGRRLILLTPEVPATWMSEHMMLELKRKGINFMDITDHPNEDKQPRPKHNVLFPTMPSHQSEVRDYIAQVQMDQVQANLETLSSFFTRYYRTTTGEDSANWLFAKVQEYASGSNVSVTQFTHAAYNQKSLIARFPGRDPTQPAVIIGAHQDSINVNNPTGGRSPGADDDGSGSVTILEIFRVLVSADFNPAFPVEFQWYAAEEVGLLGSQDIASTYREEGKLVYSMFQLDMTGYTTLPQAPVRVINDFVDPDLTAFTNQLIDEYTNLPRSDSTCGYACSDHASYYRSGYPSATTFEALTCPQIHQTGDDLNLIVWSQVEQFVFLGLAYVVELSYGG